MATMEEYIICQEEYIENCLRVSVDDDFVATSCEATPNEKTRLLREETVSIESEMDFNANNHEPGIWYSPAIRQTSELSEREMLTSYLIMRDQETILTATLNEWVERQTGYVESVSVPASLLLANADLD